MIDAGADERLRRFLQPRHAVRECAIIQWQSVGDAGTPGADATCRLYVSVEDSAAELQITAAAFAAFGPPEVVACADWACERLQYRTIAQARSLSVRDFEQSLALAPNERYAALLAVDALANALVNLGS